VGGISNRGRIFCGVPASVRDFTRRLQVYAGYSNFFPGEFIRNTGPSRDSDFF
jgi:hypothetical protein